MKLQEIALDSFRTDIFKLWAKDWLLLCAGDYNEKDYNMMTVGWGSFGVIWGKPFAMVMVRPQRHTWSLIEKFPTFTLTAFPEEYRQALNFCGSRSGRDICSKAREAGITPAPSRKIAAPGFAEAELVVECRKSYFTDLRPEQILDAEIPGKWYPAKDWHRIYFGEIVCISGTDRYRTK